MSLIDLREREGERRSRAPVPPPPPPPPPPALALFPLSHPVRPFPTSPFTSRWVETSTPDLEEARAFAEAIHSQFPGKKLAYNCSPSFFWRKNLDDATIAIFQQELGAMGYAFQFITLAGFHSLNHGMFELAAAYRERGMSAYAELQTAEFASEAAGYTATKHQREVGTGYFDAISTVVSAGASSTLALKGSTEAAQFH